MIGENVTRRAYLRPLRWLSIKRQQQMAKDARCGAIYEFEGDASERALWLSSLRAGDEAWLPDTLCLVLPPSARPDGYRPTADLATALAAVCSRGAVIIDASARIRSDDAERWPEHVRQTLARAAQGERSIEKQRKSAKAARARRGLGVSVRWMADDMAEKRAAQRVIWRSMEYRSAREARQHLNSDLADLSLRTLYEILGPRSGLPSAGGRPRGAKPK